MELRKIEDGKIEVRDYFKVTPISDFLGEFRASKSDDKFKLFEGRVERPFTYNNFVVLVNKEPQQLTANQELKMYVRAEGRVYGLSESGTVNAGDTNSQWKLVGYDNFVQGYMKDEDLKWHNMGGADLTGEIEFQGFEVSGDAELIMNSYEVYSSPYIYIFNVPEGYSAEGQNEDGSIIYEKKVEDGSGLIRLHVEDLGRGSIVLYDEFNQEVLRTDVDDLKYGDKFMLSDHTLELRYRGEVLDYSPTKLSKRVELVDLVNLSEIEYKERVLISVVNDNEDEILISFDDIDYRQELELPLLEANQSQSIYIKIDRELGIRNPFSMRKFSLEIDEY